MPRPRREKANFVYKKRRATLKTILIRFGALILVIFAISTIVYLDRSGYEDSRDDEISMLDSVYFTVVSITTTGYGDIVPVLFYGFPVKGGNHHRVPAVILVDPCQCIMDQFPGIPVDYGYFFDGNRISLKFYEIIPGLKLAEF